MDSRDDAAGHPDEGKVFYNTVVLDQELLSHITDGIKHSPCQAQQVAKERVRACREGDRGDRGEGEGKDLIKEH